MELERFTLTDDHLTLLRAMWVGWQDDEFGAPEIDPKRPYGNSDVISDIHELLTGGKATNDDGDRVLADAVVARYERLHKETQQALQILIQIGSIPPGNYEREPYSSQPWRLTDGE